MAKMTLLEMTQNILSALDSDEVNSINDTVESQQVAEVIKETFYEQFNNIDFPSFKGPINLTGLGDTDRPNYMTYGTNVREIQWLKYRNSDGQFQTVRYVTPEQFFLDCLQITSTMDNVLQVQDPDANLNYYIKTNQDPTFYTTLDQNYLIFNSYDVSVDATLQASKTFAWGTTEKVWSATDDFVPPLQDKFFPLLLAEAKSVCFINLKQVPSQKEEQRARRQRIRMQNDLYRDTNARKAKNDGPDYSRNR